MTFEMREVWDAVPINLLKVLSRKMKHLLKMCHMTFEWMCIIFTDLPLYPPQAQVKQCHNLGMVFPNLVLLAKRSVKMSPLHHSPIGGTEGRDYKTRTIYWKEQ